MKVLTNNFYKFLFGFIGIVLLSLALILIMGALSNDGDQAPEGLNLAGDCPVGEKC